MFINQYISLRRITSVAVFVAALVGLFVSCAQIEETDAAQGYLSFGSLSVDVKVEGLELTKASVPEADIPQADDFTYVITNKEDGSIYYNKLGVPNEIIPLPVGTYTVTITYGQNAFNQPYYTASKNDVTIEKDATAVVAFENVSLANAMVVVNLPDLTGHMEVSSIRLSSDTGEEIQVQAGQYCYAPSNQTVTVSFSGKNTLGEDRTISQSLGVLKPKYAYEVHCNLDLPDFEFADQSSGAIAGRLYLTSLAECGNDIDPSKVVYQISSDNGMTWITASIESGNGYWLIEGLSTDGRSYKIRAMYGGMITEPWSFTPSNPVSASDFTIEHIYDDSSVLTGSQVNLTGSDAQFSDVLSTLISERGVRLKNSSGTTLRTLSGKEVGTIEPDTNWPYLPQGTYSIESYIKIGDEDIVYKTITKENVSPTPTFTVTAYAETSYSRYLNYKKGVSGYTLDLANKDGTAEKVMDIKGTVSISDAILSDSKYSSLISATLTYDNLSMLTNPVVNSSTFYANTLENNINLFEDGAVINQAWGTHYVKAAFTFDGVAALSSSDSSKPISELICYITGLPYSYDFYNKSVGGLTNANWSNRNVSYTNQKCAMPYDSDNDAYVISPAFYIPSATISASYTVNAQYYVALGSSQAKGRSTNFYVGATSSNVSVASSYNTHTCNGNNATGKSYNEFSGNLNISNSSKYISISHTDNDYGWAIDYFCLFDFILKYAQ